MKLHTIKYYNDGNKRVEYCCVCSAEGFELEKECYGKFIDKSANKKVDIDTEKY